ncbi:MAG: glycoside hydrolase family 28 protein [Phycisphaerae bacterium]|nr:glycoside hydrolase family 28 protein [Phycisphaerae bacterium]
MRTQTRDLPRLAIPAILLAAANAIAAEDWRDKVGPDAAPDQIAPIKAPFNMPQLSRPVFPDRVFNIADYGAVGDGRAKNTQPIAAAIAACAKAGGGTVSIPKGTWLTGAIHLESNVNLRLCKGATLRFSDDPNDYLPVVFTRWAGFECCNYSPLIYARDCENVAVTGPGTIDGNGRPWWPWEKRQSDTAMRMYKEQILKDVPVKDRVYGTPKDGLRPQLISPIRCKNVLLEDFTIAKAGPFWTVDLVYCDRVIARRLRILTTGGPNTDGLNVDSSRNVLIEHCYFNTGDDCICMKSGMNEDGWRVGRPTENVVVRYNLTEKGHGGVVFGSDTSGGIRNVFFHSCIFRGTDVGVRLKSTRGRGGVVERLWGRDIDMARIRREAVQITTAYRAYMGTTQGKPPLFRNMTFTNLRVDGAAQALKLEGLPEAPIQNLRLADVTMTTTKGLQAEYADGIRLDNVAITAQAAPTLNWNHCRNLTIDGKPQNASGTTKE